MHDPAHCGTCGTACKEAQPCDDGRCVCLPPTADLQAAIDAAKPGATIHLCAGTWQLTQTIIVAGKDVTIIGHGADKTILDGGGAVQVLKNAASVILTLQDLSITRGSLPIAGDASQAGGGIYNAGALTLRDVDVTNNSAYAGGGILNSNGLFVSGGRVMDNVALEGGGIYNTGSAQLTMHGAVVRNNTVDSGGGGGIFNDGSLELVDSNVSDNMVTGTEGWPFGGGVYNNSGAAALFRSSVTGNAAQRGGGIYNGYAALTLDAGSTVSDNTAEHGGGIRNTGTVTLKSDSRVTDNAATGTGGGIWTSEGTVRLNAGSHVTGNRAATGGGFADTAGPFGHVAIADETIVTDNHLTDGITLSNCFSVATIPNCIG